MKAVKGKITLSFDCENGESFNAKETEQAFVKIVGKTMISQGSYELRAALEHAIAQFVIH